jgi:hypothetical protein
MLKHQGYLRADSFSSSQPAGAEGRRAEPPEESADKIKQLALINPISITFTTYLFTAISFAARIASALQGETSTNHEFLSK